MSPNVKLNRVIAGIVLLGLLFLLLVTVIPAPSLIIILNGIFFGALVSIGVVYYRLIWAALSGRHIYDRVRQMTLGFAVLWGAITLGIAQSIWFRAMGDDVLNTHIGALVRFLAIVAAILQVTAPDYGAGWFDGLERRVLWLSLGCGSLCAFAIILIQAFA